MVSAESGSLLSAPRVSCSTLSLLDKTLYWVPGPPAVAQEQVEQIGRKAASQREPGSGVDMQPVALPPRVERIVALVHLGLDASLGQALREAESAEASSGDRHPESGHLVILPGRRRVAGGASWLGGCGWPGRRDCLRCP